MKIKRVTLLGFFAGFLAAIGVVSYFALDLGSVPARGSATQPAPVVLAGLDPADLAAVQRINRVFNHVARRVNGSVVHIRSVKLGKKFDPDSWFRQFGPEREFGPFRSPHPPMPQPRSKLMPKLRQPSRVGLGSGVIIDPDGYIVTNKHVIAEGKIMVILPDGRSFEPEWIRRDRLTDLALIKIKAKGLAAIEFGDSDLLRVGDLVIAVGNPFGLNNTVTQGIVSYIGRGESHYGSHIQTDAAINPGNSGGPLVDLSGKIVGINRAIVTKSMSFAGVGLVIPSNTVKFVMDQLKTGEKVVRGYLGIQYEQKSKFTLPLARSYGLSRVEGALITLVAPGTPAAKAGLKVSDVILSVNGVKVKDGPHLQELISQSQPGAKVKLEIWRNKSLQTIDLTLARLDAQAISQKFTGPGSGDGSDGEPSEKKLEALGITVVALSEELAEKYNHQGQEGVLIIEVDPESEAARQGIAVGDLILKVYDDKVGTLGDLTKAVERHADEGGIRLYMKSPAGSRSFVFIPTK